MYPAELKYTDEHEWARGESDGRVTVGITWFAQDALGDVVFVALPEVGREVAADEAFGEVESTKSVSDLYSPIAGKVIEVNQSLIEEPEKVNSDPYGDGWIAVIQADDPRDLDLLMDAEKYEASLT